MRKSICMVLAGTLLTACSLAEKPTLPAPMDRPENENVCSAECQRLSDQAQGQKIVREQAAPAIKDIPPLYVLYVIHTHARGDHLPYTDPSLTQLDPAVAANMSSVITAIADSLNRYGVRGTWEVVYGTAQGLCSWPSSEDLFQSLIDQGHEVAVHAHSTRDIPVAARAIRDYCRIQPRTVSGFMFEASKAGPSGAQAAVSRAIEVSLLEGLDVATVNLAPVGAKNPFTEICTHGFGSGNDMWEATGNLMFPWHPDYKSGDICSDNPQSDMLFIDHVSMEWLLPEQESQPPDVLSDDQFDNLRVNLEAALAYQREYKPERPAFWGFVTQITEYAIGDEGENPPHPQALSALDRFLQGLAAHARTGQIVFVTAAEAAEIEGHP